MPRIPAASTCDADIREDISASFPYGLSVHGFISFAIRSASLEPKLRPFSKPGELKTADWNSKEWKHVVRKMDALCENCRRPGQ
jgi:hypothetical protein